MAYTEYFNNVVQDDNNTYTNYYNGCNLSHANYYNGCTHGHYDVATRGSHYYNYYNGCNLDHSNYYNGCYHGYGDVWRYEASDKGANVTPPSWSSAWGGTQGNRSLNATYIEESIGAIKNLRDEIRALQERRTSLDLEFTTDVQTTSPRIGDSELDDSNPATPEFIEDDQYDALRESIQNLWNTMRADSVPGSDKNPGDKITKADWEQLANNVDTLASSPSITTYANHFNTVEANADHTPTAAQND